MGKARQVLHKSRKGKVDTESDHDTLPETAGDDPEPVKRKISKEHADILRDVAKMMTFATQDPTKQQTDPADKLPEASIPLPLLDALANDRRQSNSSTASQKKQTDAAFFFNEARKTTQRKRSQNSGACALAPDDEERKSSTFVDTLIESETMHHKLRNVVLQNEVNTKTQQIQRDKVLLVHKDNCLAAARAKSHVEARKLNTRLSEQADELRKVEKSKQKLNMIIMAKDRLLAKATIDVGFKVKTELVRHLRRLRDVLRSPNATVRHGLEEITKLETYELEQLAREDIEREVSDNDPDMQIFLLRQQLEDKTTELSEMTISHQIAEKRQAALQEKVEDLVKQLGGSIPLYTFLTVRDAVAGLNRDMATLKVAVTSLLAEGVFEDVEDTLLNELESREQTMVDKVAEAENKAEALEERLQKVEVRVNLFKDGIQSVIGTLIEAVPPADACRVPCSADETDEAEELPDVSQQAPTDSAQDTPCSEDESLLKVLSKMTTEAAFVCCQFLVVKETYEKKLKEVTSELEEAHGTIEERERELEDVRQRLDAMQKLAKTALTLKAECETLRAELSVAQTKAEESEAALHALRMEIAEIEKNVQAQISALEQRCQKAELRIPELLCERDNALGQVAALQEANEEMAAKLGSGTLGDLPEAPAEREDYVASLGTKLEQALLELTNGSSGTPDFLPAFLKKIYNQLSAAADSLGIKPAALANISRRNRGVNCTLLMSSSLGELGVALVALAGAALTGACTHPVIVHRWHPRYVELESCPKAELLKLSKLLQLEYSTARACDNVSLAVTSSAKCKLLDGFLKVDGTQDSIVFQQAAREAVIGRARKGITYAMSTPPHVVTSPLALANAVPNAQCGLPFRPIQTLRQQTTPAGQEDTTNTPSPRPDDCQVEWEQPTTTPILSPRTDSPSGGSTVKVHQIRVASPSVRFRSRRVVMTAPASTYTGADEVDGNRPSQQQPPATADGKVQNKDCKSKRAPAAGRVRDCPPQEAGGNLEKTASHWTTGRDQLAMRALHTPPPVGGAPLADKSASPVEASDHPHGADGKKPAALDSEHPRLNHKRSLSVGAPRVAALYRSPSSQEECPAELRTASTTNSNPSRKMGSHFQKTVLAGSNVFAPKEAHRAEAAADSVSSEPDRDALNYAPSFSSVAAEAGSDGGRAKKAVPFYATVNLIPPKTAPKAASTRTIDKYLRLQAASNQQQTDAVSLHNVKSVEAFLDEICHPPPQLSPIKKRGSAGDAAGHSSLSFPRLVEGTAVVLVQR
ncbi:hypothetical protein DIPPA_06966 [Diplonema papillatum]|nr:hypothetical protein DIPPA_06966 [Diplonema papillatum]